MMTTMMLMMMLLIMMMFSYNLSARRGRISGWCHFIRYDATVGGIYRGTGDRNVRETRIFSFLRGVAKEGGD